MNGKKMSMYFKYSSLTTYVYLEVAVTPMTIPLILTKPGCVESLLKSVLFLMVLKPQIKELFELSYTRTVYYMLN